MPHSHFLHAHTCKGTVRTVARMCARVCVCVCVHARALACASCPCTRHNFCESLVTAEHHVRAAAGALSHGQHSASSARANEQMQSCQLMMVLVHHNSGVHGTRAWQSGGVVRASVLLLLSSLVGATAAIAEAHAGRGTEA